MLYNASSSAQNAEKHGASHSLHAVVTTLLRDWLKLYGLR